MLKVFFYTLFDLIFFSVLSMYSYVFLLVCILIHYVCWSCGLIDLLTYKRHVNRWDNVAVVQPMYVLFKLLLLEK